MILVTGANGFIGRSLVLDLLARGECVVGADLNASAEPDETAGSDYREERLDLTDPSALAALLARHRPATVVALAETLGGEQGGLVARGTTAVTQLFEAARSHGVGRVCLASSITVYLGLDGPFREDMALPLKSPLSISAVKKGEELAARWYEDQTGLEIVALRLSNIYGPRYRSMRNSPSRYLFEAIGRDIDAGTSMMTGEIYDQIADFCHVEDCAAGIALVAGAPGRLPHGTYNIGGGRGVTDAELRWAVEAATGRNEPRPATGTTRNYMDISRARQDFGYAPRHDIESGIKAYRHWLHTHPH